MTSAPTPVPPSLLSTRAAQAPVVPPLPKFLNRIGLIQGQASRGAFRMYGERPSWSGRNAHTGEDAFDAVDIARPAEVNAGEV